MTTDPFEPIFFGAHEQKCLLACTKWNDPLGLRFSKLKTVVNSIEPLSRNRDANMIQNEHVYAICCRLEVDDYIIFGQNIKTAQSYVVVNVERASFSTFRDFPKKDHFLTVKSVTATVAWTLFAADRK